LDLDADLAHRIDARGLDVVGGKSPDPAKASKIASVP
jgi:hypothetical protein